jgi:serine/threonine protein kinase
MTPLTQVPGTPAYMPPEALITPPHYSSKLDCFSHGVLALQIITRNFPDPGDSARYVDLQDPRLPTGRVLVQYPETERRKKDIDLIEPSHPLLLIALHCLKDRDAERPSADELCGRLASLKGEPRYTHSVEQTCGLRMTNEGVLQNRQELQEEISGLRRRNEQVLQENEELVRSVEQTRQELQEEISGLQRRNEQILQEKEELTQRLQERVCNLGCFFC